ncbi:hypothetical protein EPUS_07094 [Endocarpon pusillum Z07020]|uniref:Uncharacterized protein n=1 Tax=Endocarpon pusillum (strain Z07020 / HMAS-L-300199) TaxID=1263415 RepID=U1GWB4_ENDPU|nr:uncharacterized protein EPUS_07094 [Endocarpon pusillum Z07020]ERF76386.1 hypothetical protein EPUS_07094 [Endocarpon pusillum Z07020]
MAPHWTGFFIGVSATFLISCLSSYSVEEQTKERCQKEHQQTHELADLLSDTLKYGCDKMDDYHEKVEAGLTLRDLAEPNIRKRSAAEKLARDQRFKEGKATEQDMEFRRRFEEERRKEQAERETRKRMEELEEEWRREDERLDLQRSQVKVLARIAENVKDFNSD